MRVNGIYHRLTIIIIIIIIYIIYVIYITIIIIIFNYSNFKYSITDQLYFIYSKFHPVEAVNLNNYNICKNVTLIF